MVSYENKIIVHVEDDELDRRLVQKVLARMNFNGVYKTYENGMLAARNLIDKPLSRENRKADLILMDINLPALSGKELLKRLRQDETYSMTPIVMLSGSNSERDCVESMSSGCNGYILKDKDFEAFFPKVSKSIDCFFELCGQRFV